MPSASSKLEKQTSIEVPECLKQALNVLEKKVRNLEKRKAKLDTYKFESSEGKELNEDQKLAVTKYDEVIQTLEFSRDLQKQFLLIQQDTLKGMKKQLKREQAERQAAEQLRVREILIMQDVLNNLGMESIRHCFLSGEHGAPVLTEENLTQLDKLYQLISPTRDSGSKYDDLLTTSSDHMMALLDGRSREVLGTTYRDMKDLIFKIHDCGFLSSSYVLQQEGGAETTVDGEVNEEENEDDGRTKTEEAEVTAEDAKEEYGNEAEEEYEEHRDHAHPHHPTIDSCSVSVPPAGEMGSHPELQLPPPPPTHHQQPQPQPQQGVRVSLHHQQQQQQQPIPHAMDGAYFASSGTAAAAAAQYGAPLLPQSAHLAHAGLPEVISGVHGVAGGSGYNFLQESQIDLESPHMDPAVVAAHPMAPPPATAFSPQTSDTIPMFQDQRRGSQGQETVVQNQLPQQTGAGAQAQVSSQFPSSQVPSVALGQSEYSQQIPTQTFTNQNYVAMVGVAVPPQSFPYTVEPTSGALGHNSHPLGQQQPQQQVTSSCPTLVGRPSSPSAPAAGLSASDLEPKKQHYMNVNAVAFESMTYKKASSGSPPPESVPQAVPTALPMSHAAVAASGVNVTAIQIASSQQSSSDGLASGESSPGRYPHLGNGAGGFQTRGGGGRGRGGRGSGPSSGFGAGTRGSRGGGSGYTNGRGNVQGYRDNQGGNNNYYQGGNGSGVGYQRGENFGGSNNSAGAGGQPGGGYSNGYKSRGGSGGAGNGASRGINIRGGAPRAAIRASGRGGATRGASYGVKAE